MHKQFKSVGLMTLLMALPSGAMMAANAPSEVATVQQQKSSVAKGTVKDANGEPLIGASVMVKGSANGATVDEAGNFTIKGVKVGQTLRISYIGYEGQEVKWEGQALNIVLKESNNSFSEAVVIGYGVAKKNDMTGSVAAIKPDEKNKGLVVNAQDMIQGKIAGVNVTTSSGTPGAGATIRIRGGSSLNASNDPLIVIDGLAMDNQGVKGLSNPLSMVNPADIESFTVLKDASATAIYGSRGSNGVIIITTKKGRKGAQLKVSYNGSMSVNQKRRVQEVMSGDQFVEFVKTYYGEGSDAYKALGVMEDGKQKFYNTDWQNEIYRTALSFDNNVTVTGSVKNVPFRASVGATNQEGILRTSDFNRYTASLNVNPSLLDDHLKVNLSAKYMFAKTVYADGGAMGAALGMDPTKPVRTADPRFKNFGGYYQWLQEGSVLKDSKWPETKIDLATANPLSMIDMKNDVAKSNAFVGNLELDYQVHGLKDLRLHMNIGADVSGGRQDTEISPASGTNTYYGYSGWEKINKYNLSYNAYAQYTKDFSKTQHFDVMAGYEWQHFYREGFSKGSGFYPQTNDVENLRGTVYQPKKDEWKTENYLVSFFGRAN
ncbi:MAG: SusC/RagA family TonB-linked outer membrane protein, partial [Alloprevotella sp.]|nr:SusC/RagA family TonB-linked outer membrane protein [Alloprevotella sp.]